MTSVMDGLGASHRIARVNTFAQAFVDVMADTAAPITVDELLERAADRCNVASAPMRYTLPFADTEGFVDIDFAAGTATRAVPRMQSP